VSQRCPPSGVNRRWAHLGAPWRGDLYRTLRMNLAHVPMVKAAILSLRSVN
jgi:hypothetical protein